MNSTLTESRPFRTGGTKIRLRRYWLIAHRWLGLTAGLLFVLLGLSGSALVFDHAIDEWLNPELLLTANSGPRASLDAVIDSAETEYGGKALSVTKPRVANGVWTVWFSGGTRAEPKFTAVHVDPHTAQVTGKRIWGEDLMSWIYRLHFRLLAGPAGGVLVGIIGVVMLISIISGIYLWWPLFRSSWRAAFAVRRGQRLNYDLHKLGGVVSAIFLAVITFTGVCMEFPQQFRAAVALASKETPPPDDLKSKRGSTRHPLTPDQAIALAAPYFPNAEFDHLHPPTGEEGVYEVAFRQPGEVQQSYGRTQLFLDQYTGEVVARRTPDKFTAADIFFAWQFPLHNGEAFGLAGRWIVFFLGLTPGILYVTGLLIWLRRRKSRKSDPRRSREQAEEDGNARKQVAAEIA